MGGEGGGRRYPWGDEWREDHCNSQEAGLGATSPVGLFPEGATAEGIHDMAGNVFEWCWDRYDDGYYARSREARNPQGPERGNGRVLRGGCYGADASWCRCGCRFWVVPGDWYSRGGFRCVRTLSS